MTKSGSVHSESMAKSAVNQLDSFCNDVYEDTAQNVLNSIKAETREDSESTIPMVFLDKFADYLQGRVMPSTVKAYTLQIKKYLRLVHAIRVSSEDMKDYVTLPMIDEEEKEPFIHDEIRKILDFTRIPKRKCLYMVLKDTGCRIGECLRLQKKFIDLTKNPVTVFLPKNITKGKKRKRTVFVTNETKKMLVTILKELNDDDYIFGTKSQKDFGYRTEESAFDWVRRFTKMRDRYESNRRYKKNLHSFRSFCYTQSKLATGDADYAHGYIGHEKYLVTYERLQDTEKIELFNRCAPRLSIFEDVVIVSNDELKENYEKKLDKVTSRMLDLEKKLEKLSKDPKIHVRMIDLPNIEN